MEYKENCGNTDFQELVLSCLLMIPVYCIGSERNNER